MSASRHRMWDGVRRAFTGVADKSKAATEHAKVAAGVAMMLAAFVSCEPGQTPAMEQTLNMDDGLSKIVHLAPQDKEENSTIQPTDRQVYDFVESLRQGGDGGSCSLNGDCRMPDMPDWTLGGRGRVVKQSLDCDVSGLDCETLELVAEAARL